MLKQTLVLLHKPSAHARSARRAAEWAHPRSPAAVALPNLTKALLRFGSAGRSSFIQSSRLWIPDFPGRASTWKW